MENEEKSISEKTDETITSIGSEVDSLDSIRISQDIRKIDDESLSDSLYEEDKITIGGSKIRKNQVNDKYVDDSFCDKFSVEKDFSKKEINNDKAVIHNNVLQDIPSEQIIRTIVYDGGMIKREEEINCLYNDDEEEDQYEEQREEEAEEPNEMHEEDEELEECYKEYWLSVPNKEEPIHIPESIIDEESEGISFEEPEKKTDDGFVTVKFRTDSNESMTSAFKNHTKIYQVKERLASIFKLKVDDIRLNYEDNECDDFLPLSGFGVEPFGTIELGVRSVDPSRILAPGQFRHYIPVVDVITVRIPRHEGGFKDVIVEIENQSFVKEWLGGYRHRITKIEYHHAKIQTLPRQRDPELPPLFSRDTQTPFFPLKEISIDTNPSKATQMWRTDHYIPNETDQIISADPKRFKNINVQEVMAIKIQRFYRKVIAEKKRKLAEEMEKQLWENEIHAKKQRENAARNDERRLILGAIFPIKRADFYLLYLIISKWWAREIERIKKLKQGESRKAAYLDLLEREITFLSVVDKQRTKRKKEILFKKELEFLSLTARPKIFRNHKDILSSVETVEIQQARELQEIFSSFLNRKVTLEKRLDILFTLKNLLHKYGFQEYTDEIVNLLTREAELLSLGMKGKQLDSLRDRTEQLILYFLHKYFVNPNSKNYRKPTFPKTDSSLYQCSRCKKLKPACDYHIHVKMTSFSICHSCEWLTNIAHKRIDLVPYHRLLRQVRLYELQNCCYSSNSYVLKTRGMYYLTHHIWQDRSVISGAKDINNLRSVRFRKNIDWSPWNCILLTEEESIIHLSIDDVDEFYDKSFIENIKWRHIRARNFFLPLVLKDLRLLKSKIWYNVQDRGAFIHPTHISEYLRDTDFEQNF